MKKPFQKPFIVRNFYSFAGSFPVPGIEYNCYVNNQLVVIRVSEQFAKMAQGDPAGFALRKLKHLLLTTAYKPDEEKPVNIFTDKITEIDFWPAATEGELKLWKGRKDLAVHRSANDRKFDIVKELYKIYRVEPDSRISIDGLGDRIHTPADVMLGDIQELERDGYLIREGNKEKIEDKDWLLISEEGIKFLESISPVKVAETPEEIEKKLLGEA